MAAPELVEVTYFVNQDGQPTDVLKLQMPTVAAPGEGRAELTPNGNVYAEPLDLVLSDVTNVSQRPEDEIWPLALDRIKPKSQEGTAPQPGEPGAYWREFTTEAVHGLTLKDGFLVSLNSGVTEEGRPAWMQGVFDSVEILNTEVLRRHTALQELNRRWTLTNGGRNMVRLPEVPLSQVPEAPLLGGSIRGNLITPLEVKEGETLLLRFSMRQGATKVPEAQLENAGDRFWPRLLVEGSVYTVTAAPLESIRWMLRLPEEASAQEILDQAFARPAQDSKHTLDLPNADAAAVLWGANPTEAFVLRDGILFVISGDSETAGNPTSLQWLPNVLATLQAPNPNRLWVNVAQQVSPAAIDQRLIQDEVVEGEKQLPGAMGLSQ
jgi:hypothetical protein